MIHSLTATSGSLNFSASLFISFFEGRMLSRWIVTNITSVRGTLHCRKTRIRCDDQLVIYGLYLICVQLWWKVYDVRTWFILKRWAAHCHGKVVSHSALGSSFLPTLPAHLVSLPLTTFKLTGRNVLVLHCDAVFNFVCAGILFKINTILTIILATQSDVLSRLGGVVVSVPATGPKGCGVIFPETCHLHVPRAWTFSNPPPSTECVYGFRTILRISSDCCTEFYLDGVGTSHA
jgi:hypothetical protein